MTHPEFIEFKRRGGVAEIDEGVAVRFINFLPKRYRRSHLFWSWVWILNLPLSIVVAIFYKWWLGLTTLLVVTPTLYRALRRTAARFVLAQASDSAEFFDLLVQADVLVFREQGR